MNPERSRLTIPLSNEEKKLIKKFGAPTGAPKRKNSKQTAGMIGVAAGAVLLTSVASRDGSGLSDDAQPLTKGVPSSGEYTPNTSVSQMEAVGVKKTEGGQPVYRRPSVSEDQRVDRSQQRISEEDRNFIVESGVKMNQYNLALPEVMESIARDFGFLTPWDMMDESQFPPEVKGIQRDENTMRYSYSLLDGRFIQLDVQKIPETGLSRYLTVFDSDGEGVAGIMSNWNLRERHFMITDRASEFRIKDGKASYSRAVPSERNPDVIIYEEYHSDLREAPVDIPVVVNKNVPVRHSQDGLEVQTSYLLTGNSREGYEGSLRYKGWVPKEGSDVSSSPYQDAIASFPNIAIKPVPTQKGELPMFSVRVGEKESFIQPRVDEMGYAVNYEYVDGDPIIPVEVLGVVLMDKIDLEGESF